eukprot:SAG11_NODE_19098_length_474_cov_1.021333_1_plen_31_part_01
MICRLADGNVGGRGTPASTIFFRGEAARGMV